MTICNK